MRVDILPPGETNIIDLARIIFADRDRLLDEIAARDLKIRELERALGLRDELLRHYY